MQKTKPLPSNIRQVLHEFARERDASLAPGDRHAYRCVLFFLELAEYTGDAGYLDDARAGADFLLARMNGEALGVDEFIYYASMGLGQAEQKRSMELFCKEVMPAFA